MDTIWKIFTGIIFTFFTYTAIAQQPKVDSSGINQGDRAAKTFGDSTEGFFVKDQFLQEIEDNHKLARIGFGKAFTEARSLIIASKLDKAAKPLAKLHEMKDQTNYERVRILLLDFWYASKAGDSQKENDALVEFVALAPNNIDSEIFIDAGVKLLKRQINNQDIGRAVDTLNSLKQDPNSQTELTKIAPVVKKLEDFSTGNKDIVLDIKSNETGKWSTKLLRPTFYLTNISGAVNAFDFTCEKHAGLLTYTPESVLAIPSNWGKCSVIIMSSPNTNFRLIQREAKPGN